MSLLKFLTTVTSFSKILTAVIFVILPFAGFYLGIKYEAQFIKYLEDRTSLNRYNLKLTLTPTSYPTAIPAYPNLPSPVKLAFEDFGEKFALQRDGIKILELTEVEWNDASLGCPEPNAMYAQVITPGYKVRFAINIKGFENIISEYHMDKNKTYKLCATKGFKL